LKASIAAVALVASSLALTGGRAHAADDAPTIMKDSVQLKCFTLSSYQKQFDHWSWVPEIAFRVNGPVASGSQLYVEVSMPGQGPWVKFDCHTQDTQPGHWMKTSCGARDISEDKGSLYTGPVTFAIKLRNELSGAAPLTLFSGTAKVEKAHSNEHGPKAVAEWVYFVNEDWNLPIGYVFYTPDDVKQWNLPTLHVAFWVRGDASSFQPHLFFQGKEVGKRFSGNDEVGKAGCDQEVEDATTNYVADDFPQKAKWTRMQCVFPNVKAWDKTGEAPGPFGPPYLLAGNPGEYEFKLLWHDHLARSIKFRVDADGHYDDSLARSNKLGNGRAIVPVGILGDQDGPWDRAAWHAAFYGNPLTGFVALP
jgi:hypothetical protein